LMNCCTKGIALKRTDIVDADLSKYFDTIPHSELLQCVARRIVDRQMLSVCGWLKVPVEERDENGKRRLTGGKDHDRGTPQGGVVRAALANLYRNRMLQGWRQTQRGEQFRAHRVNYADDCVILRRGKAKEAREWTRGVLERLELTLHEKKTSVRKACRESFDFLGYTFGPHSSMRTGREYSGYSPSQKSVARSKEQVGDLLEPSHVAPWQEVCERLNQQLRGWRASFGCGATAQAYRAVDEYVYDRVRQFLRRRHQVVCARHSPVPGGTGVRLFGRSPAPRVDGRAFVSRR